MWATWDSDRRLVGVMAVVLASLIAALPLAYMLDHRIDRTRPMYADRLTLAGLEFWHIQQQGSGLTLTLDPGEEVTIAGRVFTPSAGTTLSTRLLGHAYCVRATNEYGDTTDWRCWDNESDPRESPGYPAP